MEASNLNMKEVVASGRGRAYHLKDGSFIFHPEAGNTGTLYETVGSPLRNGSLQKTGKIYKLSVTAPVSHPDPGMYLRKTFEKLVLPLEQQSVPQVPERAEVMGKTDHAVVSRSEENVEVLFRFPGEESASNITSSLTKEVVEVCSIISRISTSRRGKSTPKKSSGKSRRA